jgi:tRNA pseudouridine38-40 synthase
MSAEKLRYAIGSRLAPDVTIREAMDVNEGFHASRGAISKSYRYRLFNARHRPVAPETLRYVRHVRDVLDVDKMREAAARFIGEKDFAGVANKGVERETTVREVFRCDVERRFEEIRIDVEGSGFLYNQVRIMVGTLIEIGRGRWVPERVTEILESKDRSNAGPTAPPQGLSLMWVRYPASLLRPS